MQARYRAGVIGCGVVGSFIEDTMRGAGRFGLPNGHASCYAAMHEMELAAARTSTRDAAGHSRSGGTCLRNVSTKITTSFYRTRSCT